MVGRGWRWLWVGLVAAVALMVELMAAVFVVAPTEKSTL